MAGTQRENTPIVLNDGFTAEELRVHAQTMQNLRRQFQVPSAVPLTDSLSSEQNQPSGGMMPEQLAELRQSRNPREASGILLDLKTRLVKFEDAYGHVEKKETAGKVIAVLTQASYTGMVFIGDSLGKAIEGIEGDPNLRNRLKAALDYHDRDVKGRAPGTSWNELIETKKGEIAVSRRRYQVKQGTGAISFAGMYEDYLMDAFSSDGNTQQRHVEFAHRLVEVAKYLPIDDKTERDRIFKRASLVGGFADPKFDGGVMNFAAQLRNFDGKKETIEHFYGRLLNEGSTSSGLIGRKIGTDELERFTLACFTGFSAEKQSQVLSAFNKVNTNQDEFDRNVAINALKARMQNDGIPQSAALDYVLGNNDRHRTALIEPEADVVSLARMLINKESKQGQSLAILALASSSASVELVQNTGVVLDQLHQTSVQEVSDQIENPNLKRAFSLAMQHRNDEAIRELLVYAIATDDLSLFKVVKQQMPRDTDFLSMLGTAEQSTRIRGHLSRK